MEQHADMHKPGVYAVVNPAGVPLMDTFSTTGYSARSQFVRNHNTLWSKAELEGFCIIEFAPVAKVTARPDPKTSPRVPYSREDWGLYDLPGAAEAANTLGQMLRAKLNEALTSPMMGDEDWPKVAKYIRNEMVAAMAKYDHLGARDTQPKEVLARVIGQALGVPLKP